MIGKLTGRVDQVSLSAVIVDVGGVGYEVTVGARTLTMLPPVGEVVSLAIDTHVREDEIKLYGFGSEHERAWFRALQTVQGVGAKVAARIVAELKDKMPTLAPAIRPLGGLAPVAVLPEGLAARDAVSALTNLGYAHGEAAAAISAAVGKAGREARAEELIRLGLKELAQ
jgi:Holliday junction DNA helicase RuvA